MRKTLSIEQLKAENKDVQQLKVSFTEKEKQLNDLKRTKWIKKLINCLELD